MKDDAMAVGPRADRLEQSECAGNVRADEITWSVDAAVDVTFGREVHDEIRTRALEQIVDGGTVGDVHPFERVVRTPADVVEIAQIGSVCQDVDVDEADLRKTGHQQIEKVRTDEAGSACDDYVHHEEVRAGRKNAPYSNIGRRGPFCTPTPADYPAVNVLFLTHRLPYAPNRGDRVRAFHVLRMLAGKADVEVVSLAHDAEEAAHGADLAHLASSVRVVRVARYRNLVRAAFALPTARPLTHVMLDAPTLVPTLEAAVSQRRPDVVLAYCSGMARLAMAPPLAGVPFVLDMVDVDSAKWRDLSRVASRPLSWIYRREASCLRTFEARATRAAVRSLVVTDREREELLSIVPGGSVTVVPNGVDVDGLQPTAPPARDARVVFCGVLNYAPNEEAARLLGRDIWPLVRRRRPDATLTLVGSSPTATVRALASRELGIEVTGAVPDVRPYLWSAAVAAAPLVTARGIQNKVLEAVAAGLPTVVTPNIMDSLPLTLRPACVSATGAAGLADAIVALLDMSPADRRATASRADVGGLAWERQLAPLADILQEAAATRPQPR